MRPAAVMAVLLIIPILVVHLYRQESSDASSPSTSYISGGGIETISSNDLPATVSDIETTLRAGGVQPTINFEPGGTAAIVADVKSMPEADRKSFAEKFGLSKTPAGQIQLRVEPVNPSKKVGKP